MKVFTGAERFVQKYRSFFHPGAHRFYRALCRERAFGRSGHPPDGEKPYAVFDFKNPEIDGVMGRRAYLLFIYFLKAGYAPLFMNRYRFLASMRDRVYKSWILRHPFQIVKARSEIPGPYLLVADHSQMEASSGCQKTIRPRYNARAGNGAGQLAMPFTMHPAVYENSWEETLDAVTRRPRRRRLFFAGNYEAKKYDRRRVFRKYRKLTRCQVLETVLSALRQDQIKTARSSETMTDLRGEYFNGFVLTDTSRYAVPAEEWLGVLAESDFFLACPGVAMPLCHNIAEALAAGAIPVTEYPEYLTPPLQDGVNCIAFSGREDLRNKLPAVFEMRELQIQQLRAGALEYYRNHLSIGGLFRKIESYSGPHIDLFADDYVIPR